MVLVLHTCQFQTRLRTTVPSVRNCALCINTKLPASSPSSSSGNHFRVSESEPLFCAELKVQGSLHQLLLSFKENPWAYTLSFLVTDTPRGNSTVIRRM